MPRPKRALSGVDANSESNKSSSASTMETSSSNGASNGRDEINDAAPKFIAIPRPNWDLDAEARDNEDDESEEDTEAPETLRNQDKSVTDLESPEWPWIVSSLALDKYSELEKQAENRDQELQGVYMYNDFTAYGVNEVIDNWLKDFNKEVSRRVISPYTVWAQLEALSWFLQLDSIDVWFQYRI